MNDFYLISGIIEKFTHLISIEVNYKYLKPRIMHIFPRPTISRAEGRSRASMDIMIELCENARRLSKENFIEFVDAIAEDHKHVAEKIKNEYKERTNSLWPTQRNQERTTSALPADPEIQSSFSSTCASLSAPSESFSSQQGATQISEVETVPCSVDEPSGSTVEEPSHNSVHATSIRCNLFLPDTTISISSTTNTVSWIRNQCYMPQQDVAVASSSNTQMKVCDTLQPSGQGQMKYRAGNHTAHGLSVYQHQRNKDPDDVYRMETTPRGLAVIINNIRFIKAKERQGSQEDGKNFAKMLKYLGFETKESQDMTAQKMRKLLAETSKDKMLEKVDALIVVILTHGGSNDTLYGTDYTPEDESTFITKSDLQKMFGVRNCPMMKGKPKIFILQACRGSYEDGSPCSESSSSSLSLDDAELERSVDVSLEGSTTEAMDVGDTLENDDHRRAETTDMCFVNSSSGGYKSYRRLLSGSPFVKKFTETVMQLADKKEISKIMRQVQSHFSTTEIGDKMTMPTVELILPHKLYFNPPRPM